VEPNRLWVEEEISRREEAISWHPMHGLDENELGVEEQSKDEAKSDASDEWAG
jgi:hypothetical protein